MELFFVTDYKVNYNREAVTSPPDEITDVALRLKEGTATGTSTTDFATVAPAVLLHGRLSSFQINYRFVEN